MVVAALVGSLIAADPAAAQATRTWVSGVGNDVNPCSRTAPCKTWSGAMAQTAAGGEINALDPGGYGNVVITKSITLDGGGTLASILASLVNGVTVNAGPSDRITLRNLTINGGDGGTPGLNGVRFLAGAELHVENVVIENFTQVGIAAVGPGNLHVSDTIIRNVDVAGIQVTSAGTPRITIERSRVTEVGVGIRLSGAQIALVHDTSITDSTGPGIWAEGAAEVHLHDVVVAHGALGVQASDGAVVNTAGLTAVGNAGAAFLAENGGEIVPFAGELITGNPPGGASTCELTGAASAVACLAGGESVCPTPVCPAPVCPAPVVEASLGNCKRCKTKGTKMVCVGCGIDLQ